MERAGEIIETATDRFVAQSYVLNQAPPFGALVRVSAEAEGGATVYGVVAQIETSALDASRRPVARGQEAGSLAQLYQEHPQLRELFCTTFSALAVGFSQDGAVRHYLPALPPPVHQFVYQCEPGEVAAFTQELTFLPLLLSARGLAEAQEVTAAFLRQAAQAHGEAREAFLVRAGKLLVGQLRGDPARLAGILARLR
ncbi:MAG: hypothetical protein HYY02_01650 [Chloroflexi bacterium]|nr:hypothetical protein [Chloroflexota bacterium]